MELKLPAGIGGKRDIVMVQREIERILESRLQDSVRATYGVAPKGSSEASKLLTELLTLNKLKDDDTTLKQTIQHLDGVRQYAPTVRIAFSQEPDNETYRKVVGWFRREINPGVLVQVGVQPNIAAGCVVRTPLHRYDFSLKARLLESTPKFLEVMKRIDRK